MENALCLSRSSGVNMARGIPISRPSRMVSSCSRRRFVNSHNQSASDRAFQVFPCEAIRRASELLLSCVESVRLEAREYLQAYGSCRRSYPRMI